MFAKIESLFQENQKKQRSIKKEQKQKKNNLNLLFLAKQYFLN